jgi:hypothetical protein
LHPFRARLLLPFYAKGLRDAHPTRRAPLPIFQEATLMTSQSVIALKAKHPILRGREKIGLGPTILFRMPGNNRGVKHAFLENTLAISPNQKNRLHPLGRTDPWSVNRADYTDV